MSLEQYIKFVLRFLKENKIYSIFLYNAIENLIKHQKKGNYLEIDGNNYIESFSQFLYKYGFMKRLFVYSFHWVLSREGFTFWNNIHEKFMVEYEKET